MFTGIVAEMGEVVSFSVSRNSEQERVLVLRTSFRDAALGESVAVNGVCLTVTRHGPGAGLEPGELEFYASQETCERSNLGTLARGSRVNLERAMRLQDRISGHLVQGHVDGRAALKAVRPAGESHEIQVTLPPAFLKYVIEKGSITLDGISLTINTIQDSTISLMIIPHTWRHTTLGTMGASHSFNAEVDMIAKYVERLTNYGNDRSNS